MERPKTRGELRDKLAEGISCEVASHVSEMTSILLRGWLKFKEFTVCPSKNEGWDVYKPEKQE